jgi:hypothetical protein
MQDQLSAPDGSSAILAGFIHELCRRPTDGCNRIRGMFNDPVRIMRLVSADA